jgi:hypothetical protein
MHKCWIALLGIATGLSALAQSTTQTVNVPAAGGTVPVTVTVTPTQVTVGDTVIPVPVAGESSGASVAGVTPSTSHASDCARPVANTGKGLYVACSRVNNPDGTEWRLRGVNRAHADQGAAAAISLAGANATRVFYGYKYGALPAFQSDFLAHEWGPSNSPVWRDTYIAAIRSLRAAGYTMPLMIDSGGCGQDSADLLTYGAAVAASDPQKNIILSFHLYGNTPDEATMKGYFTRFQALARANPNLAVVVGEFGPGRNIGPSPTAIAPEQVIADAESAGLGWLAWAWDDNNLGGCKGDDNWFDMTTLCAQYAGGAGELTRFGRTIVGQFKMLAPARAKVF